MHGDLNYMHGGPQSYAWDSHLSTIQILKKKKQKYEMIIQFIFII